MKDIEEGQIKPDYIFDSVKNIYEGLTEKEDAGNHQFPARAFFERKTAFAEALTKRRKPVTVRLAQHNCIKERT